MTTDLHTGDRIELFPAFNLSMCQNTYERGDIKVWMTWNFETGRPCMVLTPNVRKIRPSRVVPCVITLDTIHKWMEDAPKDARVDAAATAIGMSQALGLPPSPHSALRVMSLIRDYLEELVHMPPVPSYSQITRADAIITDPNTGKQYHKEVTDHA
jgi:hypothetical protein